MAARDFSVVQIGVDGLVIECALDVVIIGNGLKTEKLAESGETLQLGEFGGGNVALELQELEFNLKVVAFANVAGVKAFFADVHGFLEAVQVLLREFQR